MQTTAPKEAELARAKRRALYLLLGATFVFLATLVARPAGWVGWVRAVSEAAMVGGLADWFAVAALFHRIPTGIPFITAHTAIIPRSKDRIADNLAEFVKEKFLDAESLVGLIRRHDPAARLAEWLVKPASMETLGRYVLSAVEGVLGLVQEERIQHLLKDAAHAMMRRIDLSSSLATALDALTAEGRHQELLETAIQQVIEALDSPDMKELIARKIVEWLKAEHRFIEKGLPSGWIGEQGARVIAARVAETLAEIRRNPAHELRVKFDAQVRVWVDKLRTDPAYRAKGDEIKAYILENRAFTDYVATLWGRLRDWLLDDIRGSDSVMHRKIVESGRWLGRKLAEDEGLRATLNAHLEQSARSMAPDFAAFLTAHIRDTIRQWEAGDMSKQIELSVGGDLQAIRINGTLVGGAIGLVLYALSQVLPGLAARLGGY